ncbi:MAG: hypothetical protein IT255_09820 [Chitinophagaceae bacterium]|nr:hypothetical protein [Chitinophagaceae bacterium]
MLEIVLLYFLAKNIGNLAIKKGLPPLKWKITMIATWILFEFTGMFLGISFFGTGNLIGLMAIGLASAFGGYLLIRYILEKKPNDSTLDGFGDWENR